MVVSDFVAAVTYQATGKVNAFGTGSVKWLKILALANSLISDWQDEPDVDWDKLYLRKVSFGTITNTDTYAYPTTVRKLSQQEGDIIRIYWPNGTSFTDYTLLDNDAYNNASDNNPTFQDMFVTKGGRNLYFNRAFTASDPQFGGTLYANGYGYAGPNLAPNFLTNDSDVIPIPLYNWLVYATAAQYDATDVTRQQLVPRLEAKANQLMERMKENNVGSNTNMYKPWNPTLHTTDGAFD